MESVEYDDTGMPVEKNTAIQTDEEENKPARKQVFVNDLKFN